MIGAEPCRPCFRLAAMKRTRFITKVRVPLLMAAVLWGAPRLSAQQPPPRVAAFAVRTDSVDLHRTLTRAIEKFQDRWRSTWQKAEVKRHGMINLTRIRGWAVMRNGTMAEPFFIGDHDAMLLTPELRRYLSMLCFVESPSDRQIEMAKSRSRGDIGYTPNRAPRVDLGTTPTRRGRAPVIPPEPPPTRTVRPDAPVAGTVSWATQRLIRDPKGSVCPSWLPSDEPTPNDESDGLDVAVPIAQRVLLITEREKLIELLERAHAEFPRDEWIAGQRVRFVLDQRMPQRTIAAAEACQGTRVWCLALRGLALEQADRIAAADSVFRLADEAMRLAPTDSTCADADALLLLSADERARVAAMPCGERQRFVEQMWWLSDPLWSVPGNERFVSHRSRQTHARVRAALDRDERFVWSASGGGKAQHELTIRYGWPSYTYWPGGPFEDELNVLREVNARLWIPAPPYTAREYRRDRQALVPPIQAITKPMQLRASDWQLTAPTAVSFDTWWPREHMPLSIHLLTLATGQDAQWRRDSTVLYAFAIASPPGGQERRSGETLAAVLVGSTGPTDLRMLARSTVDREATIRLAASVPSTPLVLSAEVRVNDPRLTERARRTTPRTDTTAPARSTWFRARYGITPSPTLRAMASRSVALSTPVFVEMRDSLDAAPTDPVRVLAQMAGTLSFPRAERIAVYWEGYGFALGDTLDVRLSVTRDDEAGATRRIGERLGVVGARRDSVVITWREPEVRRGSAVETQAMPTTSRAVTLNLRDLPAGLYRLAIEMRRRDGATARSERQFQLRDDGAKDPQH